MNNILIISNDSKYTYDFRKELIIRLIRENYKVTILTNFSDKTTDIEELGAQLIESYIDRRGINPIKDLLLMRHYIKVIKKLRPEIILTYTIKPNIYGGLAARLTRTNYLPNITGLGTAVENKGLLQFITINLYRIALKNASNIFFQNEENKNFMLKRGIRGRNQVLLPGSGVNLEYYNYIEYPRSETICFLFIGRVMKAKGIDYYLTAAKHIKKKYSYTEFHVLGGYEENYKLILKEYETKNIIKYHGKVDNVKDFHTISHCIIHPTYYPEGMSNVLLEGAASGRPLIAFNRSGCKEIVENGKNGFLVETKNIKDLIDNIEKFINLSYEEKRQMGINGRNKVVKEFNRNIVVNAYINEIKKVGSKK